MEKIEHLTHEDPYMNGWYIVYYDEDGTSYDAIGPFETKEEAEAAQAGN
jgi:hypothetical protein